MLWKAYDSFDVAILRGDALETAISAITTFLNMLEKRYDGFEMSSLPEKSFSSLRLDPYCDFRPKRALDAIRQLRFVEA